MKSVLAVDNDRIFLGILCRFLESEGYEVIGAEGGLSAIDVLKDHTPDIIFIDLVMPNIDGWALCSIIRSMDRLKGAYIVILSAISAEELVDIDQIGADAAIAKRPFQEMKQDILTVLETPEAAARQCQAGGVLGVKGVYRRGITEELLSVKHHFETVLSNMSDGIVEASQDGRIIYTNRAASEMIGRKKAEILGSFFASLFDGEDARHVRSVLGTISRDEGASGMHLTTRLNRYDVEMDILPVDNNVPTCIIILRNVTGSMAAHRALKESERRFRKFFEDDLSGAFISTPKGRLITCNPAFADIFGFKDTEEAMKSSLHLIYPENTDRDAFIEKLKKEKRLVRYESIMRRKDGTTINTIENTIGVFDDDGDLVEVHGYLMDITEHKRLESRLHRSQKMEAIGTIAGGVAHDLNNVLSGIVSYPDLILMQLPENSQLRKPILTMKESGDKAAALVQDLLLFARRAAVVNETVFLNDIIANYLTSPEFDVLKSHHAHVDVKTDLASDLRHISGSSIHLHKVIMNLMANATEAMPNGGTIRILTENRYVEKLASEREEFQPGQYVVLRIVDNGVGISPEDIDKIFEPFYTKKVLGRSGTGLGMAIIWGVISDHHGFIDVHSEMGRGTEFTLYFPAAPEAALGDGGTDEKSSLKGHGETILVVDDVAMQRTIACTLLNALGYNANAVASGEAALALLKRERVDLVVLDMIMAPGMDGLETYKKIIELHPGQKTIIASGFSESDRVIQAQSLGAGAYLKKPYTLEAIGLAVKEELAR
jgi:PAS domain S-box-containing protein